MEKKTKVTKESLLKENAVLVAHIAREFELDEARRKVLSELLDSYEWISDGYSSFSSNKTTKKIITRDWLGIAFLIGELKADADYAMCIEAREDLKRQVTDLQQELSNTKNNPHPYKK